MTYNELCDYKILSLIKRFALPRFTIPGIFLYSNGNGIFKH